METAFLIAFGVAIGLSISLPVALLLNRWEQCKKAD